MMRFLALAPLFVIAACGQYGSTTDPVTGVSTCPGNSPYYTSNTRLDVRCGPQSQPVTSGGIPTPATKDTASDGVELVYPAN